MNKLKTVTEANNAVTRYYYDVSGNLTAKVMADGHTTTYWYNQFGQVVAEERATDPMIYYTYDKGGNLIQQTDRKGQKTRITYNRMGMPVSEKFYTVANELEDMNQYEYNRGGQRVYAGNGKTGIVMEYNALGQVVSETRQIQGDTTDTDSSYTLNYLYDMAGNMTQITYPEGSAGQTAAETAVASTPLTVQYSYNNYNRLVGVGGFADGTLEDPAFSYTANGFLTQIRYNNHTNISITPDDVNRVEQIHVTYTGETTDAETGRFIREDDYRGDINNPKTLHYYSYVANNPLKYVDPSGNVFLQAGAKGGDVKYVQALLNIPQTGVFDERTVTAVNTFKEKYGLGNTGVWKGAVGDQTLDAMKNAAFALPIPSAAEYAQSNGIWVNSDDSKYLNWGKNGDDLISSSIGISEEITGKGQAITSDWEYKYYLANVSPAMEGIAEGQFGNISRTTDPKRYSESDWLVYQDALLGGQGLAGSINSIADIYAYNSKANLTPSINENQKIFWGNWDDYEHVILTVSGKEQTYAIIGNRYYSKHAVDRMQPSGKRYGHPIVQVGGDYGRSVSPTFVEYVIQTTTPYVDLKHGTLAYISGSLKVVTNYFGDVVTIITNLEVK